MKRIISLVLMTAVCLSMSGCSFEDELGAGGLLSAPMMTVQQKEIHEALTTAVGKELTLKYPKNGDNRSAFVIENIDDEPTEEAIVFYQYKSAELDEGTVHVHILDQIGGKWSSVMDFSGSGAEVDRIFIAPLKEGKPLSIIIGYSTLSPSLNQFQIYSYDKENINTVYTDNYSLLNVVDFDGDGYFDIFKSSIDPETGETRGVIIGQEGNEFYTIAEVRMSEYVSSYVQSCMGKTENGSKALFVDSINTDGELQTDIITKSGSAYQNLSLVFKDKALDKTVRDSGYLTMDVDGDGIYEIPTNELMEGYKQTDNIKILVTSFSGLEEDYSLKEKYKGYYMINDGYFFNMPPEMLKNATVKIDETSGEAVFYRLEKTALQSSKELFRINVVNESEYENYRALGYMLIKSSGLQRYIVKRTSTDDELCLKLDDIKKNFYLLP